jgi:hypothetical protein
MKYPIIKIDGKPYPIVGKAIEDWEFTGLSNVHFITSNSYKVGRKA